MSDVPGHMEVAVERQLEAGTPVARVSGKGPFILAKVIVSYLQKKKEVVVYSLRLYSSTVHMCVYT